ncbi:MAG: tail fiber domain-containing protein [Chthoniobacterales bacterium]|nr:tail fiber domain-containing protein [Chthoniobacterales bacterium]
MKTPTPQLRLTCVLAAVCLALAPAVFAIDPPPDGGYKNRNTAEGEDALFSLTNGSDNTATGYHALYDNKAIQNTASGSLALSSDTTGSANTAAGFRALAANTTGLFNTATGSSALQINTTGSANTATGEIALASNTTGFSNVATGLGALLFNSTGSANTAEGYEAMWNSFTGSDNTAVGADALHFNTLGNSNTAIGFAALNFNGGGNENTAVGFNALLNNVGNGNVALGFGAGENLTTGQNNIAVGNPGVTGESGIVRIGTEGTQTAVYMAGITTSALVEGVPVGVSPTGQLGVKRSSARFKEVIKPMNKSSEAIFSLRPVTFRYKKDIDPKGTPQFGLVAEEVEKIDSALVAHDEKGQPFTVRYEEVNAMLLNEFLKEHRKVEVLEASLAQQQKTIEELSAGLKEQAARIKGEHADRD